MQVPQQPDEAGLERLLEINRDYGGIENGLHYRRDKTLREDATRMSNPTLAEAAAILNNLVIGLAIHQGWRNLLQARRHYKANLQDALNLVLRHPPFVTTWGFCKLAAGLKVPACVIIRP